MPANTDADYLCEYFISSSLYKSSSSTVNSSSTKLQALQKLAADNSKQTPTISRSVDQLLFDTIDFVKYDKNTMDLLKSKYKLLNNNNNNNNAQANSSNLSLQNHHTNSTLLKETKQENGMFKNTAWLDLGWCKIKHRAIGLLNLGNNCYLNATLQCLAYTPPLSQWLVAKPHSPSCRLRPQKGFCSLCEVERIVYDMFNASGGGFAKPNSLCYNIKSKI